MKQSITHRPLLVAIILLISVFTVSAQDFVVVGSSRVIKVDKTAGYVYKWEIKQGGNFLNFKKETDTYVVTSAGTTGSVAFIGGLNPADSNLNDFFEVKIKWPNLGDYKIFMTCVNASGCDTKATFDISVVPSPILATFLGDEYDVVTSQVVGNVRKITIPIKFTEVPDRTDLPTVEANKTYNDWKNAYFAKHNISKYKLNIKYKYYTENTESAEYVLNKLINNTDNCKYDCNADYFRDFGIYYNEQLDDNTDRYFDFTIDSIQDIYGAEVSLKSKVEFVFGIYKRPDTSKIQYK
ncbi:MAG: hypothetical protein WBG43_11410 [Marinifilaceae bacterium]